MEEFLHFTLDEAVDLARNACLNAGASQEAALSLARATVSAERCGVASVGFRHLADYLTSMREGRIDPDAEPEITSPLPALIASDARGGIAQTGFDRAFDDLVRRANTFGIALFSQKNSYTAGELGYYPRRLAEAGLVAFAATNGPALMASPGAKRAVYCTNPLAFSAPRAGQSPLLIDQAASATAYLNIRSAAERGETIPQGWAVDDGGQPTTDPNAALKGMLLTFGGARGANIALMVEVLAAGLSGASWSLDAPGFAGGNASPGAGLLIIAISPALLDPGFAQRLSVQCQRLSDLGVHIPGAEKGLRQERTQSAGLTLPAGLVHRIAAREKR